MSITTALKARREALRDREAGFTLIELLVVVIIIGILAAIAIPIYIGVQNNAKDSSVKSDLGNQKTAVVAFVTNSATNALPTQNDFNKTTLGVDGWVAGTNLTAETYTPITTGTNIGKFCILATSVTGNKFAIVSSGAITGGATTSACPASQNDW